VNSLLPLGTALLLGVIHALEIDHMMAVTAFVSRRPTLATSFRFGLRWGIGHSLAVFVAGAIILATGRRWAAGMETILEGAVGVALVGVGIWSVRTARNLHPHQPGEHRAQGHAVASLGVMHGLAGTTAVVALLPVTLLPGRVLGIAYLACFGVGVTAGMAAFALVAAAAMRRAAAGAPAAVERIARWAGAGGIAVGLWWLSRVLLLG
jgi:hypothetical protein